MGRFTVRQGIRPPVDKGLVLRDGLVRTPAMLVGLRNQVGGLYGAWVGVMRFEKITCGLHGAFQFTGLRLRHAEGRDQQPARVGRQGVVPRRCIRQSRQQIAGLPAAARELPAVAQRHGQEVARFRDMRSRGGWICLGAGGPGARTGGAGPAGIERAEIGLEVGDGLACVAGLLDRAGLLKHDLVAQLASDLHLQDFVIELISLAEIGWGGIQHLRIGRCGQAVCKGRHHPRDLTLARAREQPLGFFGIDGLGLFEALKCDQGARAQEAGFRPPI